MEKLLKNIEYTELNKTNYDYTIDDIKGIEYDSRKINEGYVFVAMEGSLTDGHSYIKQAIEKGAIIIFVEKNIDLNEYGNIKNVKIIKIEKLREKLGEIASNYYDFPQHKIKIIGITGTNGKTTCSYILENLLENTSRVGTTGHRILRREIPTVNTTPESLDLIKLINESVEKSVDYFIMEVSSHALEIGRVNMIEFDDIIFTNLTQDHLDFHGTMDSYFNAKKKIFSKLRENGNAVVNIDDSYGKKIVETWNNCVKENYECKSPVLISLKDKNVDLYGEIIKYNDSGMDILIKCNDGEYKTTVKLVGEYNLSNILECVAVCLLEGIDIERILDKLMKMNSVPGRFELIENNRNAMIVVDFAHTEDGLKNICETAKKITKGKLILLFGAGGNRDKKKRPKMGEVASKYADYIVLTSDNPRDEVPIDILREIELGLKNNNYDKEKYILIEDREEAIDYAIKKLLCEGDTLIIAGKGHETYQIIGNEKRFFDDREVVWKKLYE